MKKVVSVATLILGLTGCAGVSTKDQVDKWAHLSKEHFAQTVTLKDDSLETVATFDTQHGFQFASDVFGTVSEDDFFRAFVDKKTGKATYQLYWINRYRDSGWRYYNRINYNSPEGVKSVAAEVIYRNVDCTGVGSTYKQCMYEEHLGVTLNDGFMRWLAVGYSPNDKAVVLKYKVSSKSGEEQGESILAAEAAGLLDRVDAYLAAKGLAKN